MKLTCFLAVLAAALTTSALAVPTDTPMWQDFLMHDCVGGSHFMPSTPFGVSFDTSVPEAAYNQLFNEILERLGCSGDGATAADVNTRYLPSVDMLFAHIFGQDDLPSGLSAGGKKQNFYDSWLPMVRKFETCISSLEAGNLRSGIDVTNLLPQGVLCSATDYLAGKPCFIKSNTKNIFGVELGLTLQKCPGQADGNAFMSLSCLGDMCSSYGKICQNDGECGTDGHCLNIPLGDPTSIAKGVTQILQAIGMQTSTETGLSMASTLSECVMAVSDATLSLPWKFINRGLNIWNQFFDTTATPSTGTTMGVCLHKGLGENGFQTIGSDLENRFMKEFSTFSTDMTRKPYAKVEPCKNAGCSVGFVGNGICEAACNIDVCDFDGGDCIADVNRKTTRPIDGGVPSGKNGVDWSAYIRYPQTGTAFTTPQSSVFYRYEMPIASVYDGKTETTKHGVCMSTTPSLFDGCLHIDEANCGIATGCTWIKRTIARAQALATCTKSELVGQDQFYMSSEYAAANTKHANPICGDLRCDSVKVYMCQLPFCDPTKHYKDELLVPGDVPNYLSNSYTHWISEASTCPGDCTSGCSQNANKVYKTNNLDTNQLGQACDEDETYKMESVFTSVGTNVVAVWDGKLVGKDNVKGMMANAATRMFGKVYHAPTSALFQAPDDALVMFRSTCRGEFGMNFGNGLRISMAAPKSFEMFRKIFKLFYDYQSCRAAVSSITGFDLTRFRDNWELWQPIQIAMKRFDSLSQEEPNYGNDPLPNGPFSIGTTLGIKTLDSLSSTVKSVVPAMPKSCSYASYSGEYENLSGEDQQSAGCRLKFTHLNDIFTESPKEEVLFEMKRCQTKDDNFAADSFPAMSLVLVGNSVSTTSVIKFCDDAGEQSTCDKGLKCLDLDELIGLSTKTFVKQELATTVLELGSKPSTKISRTMTGVAGTSTVEIQGTHTLIDAVGIFPFGVQARSTCDAKPWGSKANLRLIRNLVLRAQEAAGDGKTELKICVPAMVVDSNGQTSVLAQTLATRAQTLAQKFTSASFVEDMSTTDSACLYGIQNKIAFAGTNLAGKELYTVTAEEGKKFQLFSLSFKGALAEKYKESACGLRPGIGKMQINLFKKINFDNWKDFKAHHIIVDCQNTKIRVYVQVSENNGVAARSDIKSAYDLNDGEDAVLELVMAGVDSENLPEVMAAGRRLQAPSKSDLEEVEISPTMEKEITIEGDGLDGSILSIMRSEGLAPEEKGAVFNIPLWSVVLIAVFSVFCLCACAGGVFTMLSAKKAGNTQNRQHKTTDIPNPTAGAHPELGVITVSAQVSCLLFVVCCCCCCCCCPSN